MQDKGLKKGLLVEVFWMDAIYLPDTESLDSYIATGGAALQLVGYVHRSTAEVLCICGELEDNESHRDFNIIPWGIIKKVKVLR